MDDDRHAWARILVGKPLGHRYKLDGLLGVGGMGAVYAATNLAVGRRVAIKLLAPGLLRNPTAIERFQQEARLAATVGGTGVVEMLDFEVDPAMGAFLVMEHLYGESVDARIARLGQIDVGETLWIGTHLLETLAAIHRHGVIHRDLKPANVFLAVTVEGNEVVKVLDFGLSRILEDLDPTRLTGRGATLGTPAYMAPEQAKGGRLDHRTDLYGAAAVLYACLTGRPPRDSWLVLDDVPAPVHAFRSDVPRALSDVIARAMSSDPLARHDDADALAAALRAVVDPSSWDTTQRRRGGSYATQQTDLRGPVEPGARANPLDGGGGAGAAAPTTPPVLSSLGSSPAASSHHPSSTVATSSAAVPVVSSAAVPVVSPPTGAIPQPLPPTGAIPQPLPPTGAIPQPLPPTGAIPQPPPPTGAIPQPLPPTGAIGQSGAAVMPAAVVATQAPAARSVRWLIVALVAALVAAVAATAVAVAVVLRSPAGAASTIPATDPGAPAPAAVVAAVATTPLSTDMMTRVQQGRAMAAARQDASARALLETVIAEAEHTPAGSSERIVGAEAALALGDLETRAMTEALFTATQSQIAERLAAVNAAYTRVERYDRGERLQCARAGQGHAYRTASSRPDASLPSTGGYPLRVLQLQAAVELYRMALAIQVATPTRSCRQSAELGLQQATDALGN